MNTVLYAFLASILVMLWAIFLQIQLIIRQLREFGSENPEMKPIFTKKRHAKRPTELARDWLERRSGRKAG